MNILKNITYTLILILFSGLFVTLAQPIHIPFLGSQDQFDEDQAITTYLVTGNEENISFLTLNEFKHIVDVKNIIDVLLLILFTLVLMFTQLPGKTVWWSPYTILILVAPLLLIDFSRTFEEFHQLFFPQGNYSFSYDSILITTYPESFFVALSLCILGLFLIIPLGIKLNKK
jgi:uncharacterized membrane protein